MQKDATVRELPIASQAIVESSCLPQSRQIFTANIYMTPLRIVGAGYLFFHAEGRDRAGTADRLGGDRACLDKLLV